MAKKTNVVKNGKDYYRICRKVGKRLNKKGQWVDHYKDFYGSGKAEAEAKYNEYMKYTAAGVDLSGQCLGEIIDNWIETTFKQSDLAAGTIRKYTEAYNNNFRNEPISGKTISDITAFDLQEWANTSPARYSAKRSTMNLLRRFFKYAEINKICRDITASVELTKPKSGDANTFNSIDVWAVEDLQKLFSVLDPHRLRLLVILAVNTGARFSELLALTYDDFSDGLMTINKQVDENGADPGIVLSNTKSYNSNRVIPLPDPVLQEIKKHRKWHLREMKENGYKTNNVFTTNTGNYYYRRSVLHALDRIYKRYNIPHHTFHAFRHTFGTNLSKLGVPIEETAALMGHADISITAKYYVEISADRKKTALEKIAGLTLDPEQDAIKKHELKTLTAAFDKLNDSGRNEALAHITGLLNNSSYVSV